METEKKDHLINHEYQTLHEVVKALNQPGDIKSILESALRAITQFEEIKVQRKAGIFLADEAGKVLNLFAVIGDLSEEFMEKEKVVPYGSCLCGRAAESGELLMSESCFTDPRHERTFTDMTAHGHYIVPMKLHDRLVGIMFLYTNTEPSWYKHSQEVLLSIGGLMAHAVQSRQESRELEDYKNRLVEMVHAQTKSLVTANRDLEQKIEEKTRLSQRLEASARKLRDLGNHIQSIREEEKTRIAREVHDELGQALTGLKMDLAFLESDCAKDAEALKKIAQMKQATDATMRSVQRISAELRPVMLDTFGLWEAVSSQLEEFQKRSGLKTELKGSLDGMESDPELETILFRIFQETLTNVLRHADASRVSVCFSLENESVIMKVSDNGKGLDLKKTEDAQSLGILGMRERALMRNGSVEFENERGALVTVRIPLNARRRVDES
ncbi:MAG: GAF domain-containing sensor histidine kinase [Candidatus Nitrohelix vancouverensis]|uniref:GAF domain-containing sensor histidine kinase n=1 Tax=Candidatus Nitrohelix vancouverensis TaxID=2705534 RepID=A0A7T0C4N5_9BACT|nr:MAG: GAF domain-containing sensor histidine kinase [Candidatus Nitrohelix vancouverensis]